MAITLTPAYIKELNKNTNTPNTIIEITLDGPVTHKWGINQGGFNDVNPILSSVSSLQNKIDVKGGYATMGQLTIAIKGRNNFVDIIADKFLKNRRVVRKDGFLASGFLYTDYADTFNGKIFDWSRKGDTLTLIIADDLLVDAKKKLPVETAGKTQFIKYSNTNPIDMMLDIIKVQLGVDASLVDTTQFEAERDLWYNSWRFDRVLTKADEAKNLLAELQLSTNSYIINDGEKISLKSLSPVPPGINTQEYTDNNHILSDSLSQKSGLKDNFFNRIVVYYDYDESGSNGTENYENAIIALDATSQSSSNMDEVRSKFVKSKSIKSHTYAQPVNVTGVTIYKSSIYNEDGTGVVTYTFATNTLKWTAPSGVIGPAVTVSKDGRYQLFDDDSNKYIRVVVDVSLLPVSNKTDTIIISSIAGAAYASSLATKILTRYKYPISIINFSLDINDAEWDTNFIKPTDYKNITSDETCDRDRPTWIKESVMLTSVRPDFTRKTVAIEAMQTRIPSFNTERYGFIAPTGAPTPDYEFADETEREFAHIGRTSDNKVFDGTDFVKGYRII